MLVRRDQGIHFTPSTSETVQIFSFPDIIMTSPNSLKYNHSKEAEISIQLYSPHHRLLALAAFPIRLEFVFSARKIVIEYSLSTCGTLCGARIAVRTRQSQPGFILQPLVTPYIGDSMFQRGRARHSKSEVEHQLDLGFSVSAPPPHFSLHQSSSEGHSRELGWTKDRSNGL